MTTPSSSFPLPAAEQIDTGPLSWVMGEVREALNRSNTSLQEAVGQDAEVQTTTLRHAKTFLHQAHGALQIVDIDGVAIITETIEDLFDRMESGKLVLTDAVAQMIDIAYQALIEYLEDLLSGAPHQPVRLFPYYRALLEARGAERIHPADLFFPNLSIRPQLPVTAPAKPVDYNVLRKRFERALLPFLKSPDGAAESAHASEMRDLIRDVEHAQTNPQLRIFWWVLHGFAEAVADGQVPSEVYIKQLYARINLQLRRLSEGSNSIAERLLRDALFFIAKAQNPSPLVRQIRAAYQIGNAVPPDYETRRYGQIDVSALVAAKERLSQAKNMWNRIASGDPSAAEPFEHEMAGLATACAKLNSSSLSKLLRELNGIARHAARATPGDAIGLEIATSLLFVEHALGNINQLPSNFAARADAMSARLLSIVSGEQPTEQAEWLDDMSRQAQQRQTVQALATEMQSSLRQVEKMLEEYFNDPAQNALLAQIGPILHQIEGALAVLDQDDATHAIQHTRATLERFANAPTTPERAEFEHVARNIGALSFFIESLQLNADVARQRFAFDAVNGIFQAKLVEKKSNVTDDQDGSPVNAGLIPDQASAAEEVRTVEDELAYHQRQSAALAVSLSLEPDNVQLQEQLKESLEQVKRDARLIDNPDAGDRARAAIDLLDQSGFAPSNEALATIIASPSPSPSAPPAAEQQASPAPDSDEAVDAELLEIFLLEADEVLACIRETVPYSRSEPFNQDHLTTLRRSFHTLKGSGRMVGLNAFGEAAWSIEQVLNVRLSDTKAGDAELYKLLDKAAEVLGDWVADLNQHGRSDRSPAALVAAAERIKAGMPFAFDERPAPVMVGDGNAESLPDLKSEVQAENHGHEENTLAMPDESKDLLSEADFVSLLTASSVPAMPVSEDTSDSRGSEFAVATEETAATAGAPEQDAPLVLPVAEVLDFPTIQPPEFVRRDDNVKQIGDIQISVPLHNIYMAETDDLIRVLSHDIAEWRHEPERVVYTHVVHAAHSLAGTSATVGFQALQEIAHALESVLQYLARRPVTLLTSEFDVLEHAVERARFMLQLFALGEMPDHEPQQVKLLAQMLQAIDSRANAPVVQQSVPVVSVTPDLSLNTSTADGGEAAEVERTPSVPDDIQIPVEDLGISDTSDLSDEAGLSFDFAEANQVDVPPIDQAMPLAEQEPEFEMASAPELQAASLFEPVTLLDPELEATDADEVDTAVVLQDELDADLLPVFLEEGRDMLPQVGELLRAWQQNPQDKQSPQGILRLLHTIKGSARMAGAMALGQHMHEMETRIEQLMMLASPPLQALDDLLARYDQGLQMFEFLQNPDAPRQVEQEESFAEDTDEYLVANEAKQETEHRSPVDLPALVPVPDTPLATPFHAGLPTAAPVAASTPLVRVRADILDRLVNQAGEVSIARSKIETEVGTLRTSLMELNENVARLREQLREIEMQAESQITSRMANAPDREFDPLEFDRFTRLQELTRMMAESVNDVGSVQQNLNRTIDSAADDLTTQARLTRDLQQDLMRVRMVQFASISERLYRVTRQASKEVGKRVHLDIRGSTVEVDRSVLERMAGPFEHLLRNSIVHGIESREFRQAAGKQEVGELLVEIRQEGNEVVIQFSDDGQGLNLERIRGKAQALGLLTDDANASDAELADLIFHPGFSTANEVTELAGRGVGMDVVRSEAAALGGRVLIRSEPGRGAQFTIHLPLTLAVTQVVLLSTGGKTYAVPSVLVEQVQQLRTNNLALAYNEGAVMWQGQRVAMHYLSSLLADHTATPITQQYSPILILKSGNDRVAIHVDEVIGNREVVVKNIGPQLARMAGIAGATVLGSGDIVLILNPVPLALRVANENIRAPRLLLSDTPDQMGAVAELAANMPARSGPEPVQGLRTQHIVMVVDDSLTVRRVTQRLLSREGYQVILAKDGVDALEHLQSITPDVMLVDIEMPRMDGFDLTRNIRSDERTRHIPIIMITSRTASKHHNYAMELGVNEYLGKPYQEERLLQLIADFVSNKTSVA